MYLQLREIFMHLGLCCAVLCCAVLCSAVLCCAVLCCAVLLQEASLGSDTEVAGICSKEFIQWFIWLHFKECTYGLMNSRAGFCKPVNLQTCKAAKLLYPSHNLDYTVSWIADSFKVAKESYRSTLSMIIILMFFPGNSPPNETGVKVALCR